ncbi:RDD family protein [Paenibacillus sp. MMS18-CY102]|uniref:RDD family protein n=1 Tax=Paenibacillus sp. MMS18-CY102 TaxID=2682849 RepID=UPI001366671A|nr:RDD family protein [Paenibacillus sp. MMS18-CY102]MWC27871.1 hypothetical protein [Paenibacillus sp. MMS18-CY102]
MDPIQLGKNNNDKPGTFMLNYDLQADQNLSSVPQGAEAIVRSYDSASVFFRRWAAVFIDSFLICLILFGLLMWSIDLSPKEDSPWQIFAPFMWVGSYLLLGPIYYWLLETFFGMTVGKWAMRIRVVNANGQLPGIGQAAIRNLLRILEFCPLMLNGIIAGILVLAHQKRQRLGDMAAKTFVLKVRHLEPLERNRLVGMRVTHITIIVLALASLIGGISFVVKGITADQILETKDGRYALTVPGGWTADDTTDSELVASSWSSGYNIIVGSVDSGMPDGELSLGDYQMAMRYSLPAALDAELGDEESEQISLNGMEAYRFEMNGYDDEGQVQAYSVTVTGDEGNYYYIVAWLSEEGQVGENYRSFRDRHSSKLDKLERIVGTFKPVDGSVAI